MLTTRSVIKTLERLKFSDLRQLAHENNLHVHSKMTKKEIIQDLLRPRSHSLKSPRSLSLKSCGGARTESSSVTESPPENSVTKSPPVAWDKIPEPALQGIIKRLSRKDFNSLRRTSKPFNNRIKALETKDFYKALIAKLPYDSIFLDATSFVNSVAWSPDGYRLASGESSGNIRIWDFDPNTKKFQQNPLELESVSSSFGTYNGLNSVAWSPDGTLLASGGFDGIWIWEVDPTTKTFRGERLRSWPEVVVKSVAWSPDGSRLALGGENGFFKIYRIYSSDDYYDEIELKGHTEHVNSLAWSPDGTRLASGGSDGIIRIWEPDPDNMKFKQNPLELRGYTSNHSDVLSVAWSPDGTRLAFGGDEGIRLIWKFDPNTGNILNFDPNTETFQQKSLELVIVEPTDWWDHASVAWSPDGARLASGGEDGIIRIWRFDPNTGQILGYDPENELEDHTDWVFSLAWSPDGSRLASGGQNGIRIWMF